MATSLAEKLRAWVELRPSGGVTLTGPALKDRASRALVFAALLRTASLGKAPAAPTLCSGIADGERAHMTVAGAGHYGIFSGRRWRTEVYPAVRDFIAARA